MNGEKSCALHWLLLCFTFAYTHTFCRAGRNETEYERACTYFESKQMMLMIVERVAPLFNAHHTFVFSWRVFFSFRVLCFARDFSLLLVDVVVVVVVIIISRLIFARISRSRWDYINSDGQLFASVSFGRLWYWSCTLFFQQTLRLHHEIQISYAKNSRKLRNFEFVLLQPIQWTIIYFVNFQSNCTAGPG